MTSLKDENMVEVKISEVSGQALDWLIHWIEGVELHPHTHHGKLIWVTFDEHGLPFQWANIHPFSSDWAYGGPLIDKRKIMLVSCVNGYRAMAGGEVWSPHYRVYDEKKDEASYGETALLAVCRAIIKDEFDEPLDTVKVPAELIQKKCPLCNGRGGQLFDGTSRCNHCAAGVTLLIKEHTNDR